MYTSKVYFETAPPLTIRGGGAASLTVGLSGPLVRFDQSPSLFSLWPNRGGDSCDRHRRTAVPRGQLRAGMDPALLGGPSGGHRVAEVEGVAGGELRGGGGLR